MMVRSVLVAVVAAGIGWSLPSPDAIDAWRVVMTAAVITVGGLGLLVITELAAWRTAWARAGLPEFGRRSTDRHPPGSDAALAAGGGVVPLPGSARPLPLPQWDQHNDPGPDGQQDAYWYEDCGEECISMVVYACRGIEVPQGVIRVQMHGLRGRGVSTSDDMLRQLRRWHFAPAPQTCNPSDAVSILSVACGARRPCFVLGHWLSPDYLHWAVVVACTDALVTQQDPWTGSRKEVGRSAWDRMYAGQLIDAGEAVRYAP